MTHLGLLCQSLLQSTFGYQRQVAFDTRLLSLDHMSNKDGIRKVPGNQTHRRGPNNVYIPLRSGGAARSVSAHGGSDLADGGLTDKTIKSELGNSDVSQEKR